MRGLEEALGSYDDQSGGWLQELDIPQIDLSISVAMKLMRGNTTPEKSSYSNSKVFHYDQILIAHHCN